MTCPVCEATKSEAFLDLDTYPIYQHPVDTHALIEPPFTFDIKYVVCEQCSHAYQGQYSEEILNRLYEYYYYTPRPESIGTEIRQVFLDFMQHENVFQGKKLNLLEVGCSTGEVLAALNSKGYIKNAIGFEPNHEAAYVARKKGIKVFEEFFTQASAGVLVEESSIDVVLHRHVIEHIPSFEDFLSAIDSVTHQGSKMVVETPCLDACIRNESIAPFHIEHIHVFSMKSLETLLKRYGWQVLSFKETEHNNMILVASRSASVEAKLITDIISQSEIKSFSNLLERFRTKVLEEIDGREVILWGAGSGGRKLMSILKIEPAIILDSNPEKVGKTFPGMGGVGIRMPDSDFFDQSRISSDTHVVVVASIYTNEIRKALRSLRWNGGIVAPYENQ